MKRWPLSYTRPFPSAAGNDDNVVFYYGELMYSKENYAKAALAYDKVVKLDKDGKFSKEAAHAALLAYARWMKSENKADKETCPNIPKVSLAKINQQQAYPKLTMAQCRLRFVEASQRYAKIYPEAEFVGDAKFMAAEIFIAHNHHKEARDLLLDIVRNQSAYELAVYSIDLLLETYCRLGEYGEMRKVIAEIRSNSTLMVHMAELMPDLMSQMQLCEKAVDLKLSQETEAKIDKRLKHEVPKLLFAAPEAAGTWNSAPPIREE